MSPRSFVTPTPSAVIDADRRMRFELGRRLRDARLAKRWTVRELARRAGVSTDVVYLVEAGRQASTEAALRLAHALGQRLDYELTDARRRPGAPANLGADVVHSAMAEMEARHLRSLGISTGIDEPYQHFQFAGRADLIAWDVGKAALLHIENRTRFPDFQDMAGAFNAKRAYLADSLGVRLGIARWSSQTHVIAALWTSEVLHALRLRPESFRSLCPDRADAFVAWWMGQPPTLGLISAMVVLDPLASGRQRTFVGLDEALSIRARHRGYAEAAANLVRAGQ
jgi:transcriptional regulator with XRE-family HTH domain